MHARKGFGHSRIWWLLNDNDNCQPASLLAEFRVRHKDTYDRMLATLDYTDRHGPPPDPGHYKPLSIGLVEFKVSSPSVLRLYAMPANGGWLIVYAGGSKSTQRRDIAQARKRVTEVKKRGCDFE